MKKVLVTFGDSWPEGTELNQMLEKPYGYFLSNHLSCDVFLNYGQGGTSNEHMISQLREYLDKKHQSNSQVIAVFHLTNPARTVHLPSNFLHVYNKDQQICNNHFFKQIFCNFYDDKKENMRTNATLTVLQSWCKAHNIADFYFSGWVKYPKWVPEVDVDKIWAQGKETAADWFGAHEFNCEHLINVQNNEYIKPNFAHPNQLGHQLIAKKLAEWIAK